MNNRRSRVRINNKPRRNNGGATVSLLKSMDEKLGNQLTSIEPAVRDVVLPRIKREKIYSFVGSTSLTLNSSTTVETDVSYQFNLQALGNATSFEAVFDQYRIIGIKASFFPETAPASSTTGINNVPPIYTVIDYDDNNTTIITNLLQYDTLKVAPYNAVFERSLTPRMALAAYSGAFTSYASGSSRMWIDCNSPTVSYYGLKVGIPVTSFVFSWTVITEYTIQFRNTR